MNVQTPRLVCLGNFTVDDVYLPDGSVAPNSMGGDALYAALGARLWDPTVQLIAPLSPDFPKSTFEAIQTTGFDTQYWPKREAPTIRNRIFYDADGGRRWELLSSYDAFHSLSPAPQDLPAHYLHTQAFLILAMTLQAQENLIPWLREHSNAVLALDTQEDYVTGNHARIWGLISQVDIFMPSTSETYNLVGHRDWLAAARQFAEAGPPVVIIKRGEEGVLVYERDIDDVFIQPAIPGKVVDTTGAGDAFCGGFVAAYLQDRNDLRRAARAGVISASYAIASFGMHALLEASAEDASSQLKEANRPG
jgi:ribokinase